MSQAKQVPNTYFAYSAAAAGYRVMAAEADIQALVAIRTDPETIRRTEDLFRGLIAKQSRYQKHAADLAARVRGQR